MVKLILLTGGVGSCQIVNTNFNISWSKDVSIANVLYCTTILYSNITPNNTKDICCGFKGISLLDCCCNHFKVNCNYYFGSPFINGQPTGKRLDPRTTNIALPDIFSLDWIAISCHVLPMN